MVLLQPRLHLKVSQRQILTPGLVQMVSVLALNKLELKDMITAEMVENPVLEELEDAVPLIDDVGRREEERERASAAEEAAPTPDKKIRLKKLISVHSSKTISIPVSAARVISRKSSARHSRISSLSPAR